MSTTPVIISMTSFQKSTVTQLPKDANGNIIPIASAPTYSMDKTGLVTIANSVNANNAESFQFDVLGVKTLPQGSGGQVNISATFTPANGDPQQTVVVATVNLSIDPREPGPFDHFAVSATAPVDQ